MDSFKCKFGHFFTPPLGGVHCWVVGAATELSRILSEWRAEQDSHSLQCAELCGPFKLYFSGRGEAVRRKATGLQLYPLLFPLFIQTV